jgi:hypothetical protein
VLPTNHQIVTAGIFGVLPLLMDAGSLPMTTINFDADEKQLSVEDVLKQVEAYPKNVLIQGDPLHQNQEFLRLVIIDLVNKDHIVTVKDTSEKPIIWNIVGPHVRFWIDVPIGFRVNNENFRKLGENDVVSFMVNNMEQYHQAKQRMKQAKQSWNTKVTFNINSSISDITNWIMDDRLEVRVNSTQLV